MLATRFLRVVLSLAGLVSCSGSPPPASQATSTALAIGLALDPQRCVAGSNTVAAAVFIADGGNVVRYATPADGRLRVDLLQKDGSTSPADVRWLEPPSQRQQTTHPPMEWNAEIRFDSAESEACSVRLQFQPSNAATAEGLRPALTTIVLHEPPPAPAFVE